MLGLFLLFQSGCAQPSYKSYEFYESVKKSGAIVYPKHHPGDLLAHKGVSQQQTKIMIVVVIGDYVIQDYWHECKKKCKPKFSCKQFARLTPEGDACYEKYENEFNNCTKTCMDEKYKSASIAKHIEGGYYSDGSYYATYGLYLFRNIHPTRVKYEKTKWQKDRDECMELTDENIKEGFINYYQNCLKERGYELGDKKEQ